VFLLAGGVTAGSAALAGALAGGVAAVEATGACRPSRCVIGLIVLGGVRSSGTTSGNGSCGCVNGGCVNGGGATGTPWKASIGTLGLGAIALGTMSGTLWGLGIAGTLTSGAVDDFSSSTATPALPWSAFWTATSSLAWTAGANPLSRRWRHSLRVRPTGASLDSETDACPVTKSWQPCRQPAWP